MRLWHGDNDRRRFGLLKSSLSTAAQREHRRERERAPGKAILLKPEELQRDFWEQPQNFIPSHFLGDTDFRNAFLISCIFRLKPSPSSF